MQSQGGLVRAVPSRWRTNAVPLRPGSLSCRCEHFPPHLMVKGGEVCPATHRLPLDRAFSTAVSPKIVLPIEDPARKLFRSSGTGRPPHRIAFWRGAPKSRYAV
jgi:hypothetical protein